MADLRTKTARVKLKPNGNGYTQNLSTGRALLYRKRSAARSGKWVLRTAKDAGGYSFETLGTADDLATADGVTVLTYAQALEASLGRTSADPTRITVQQALEAWAHTKKLSTDCPIKQRDLDGAARRIYQAFPRATLKSLTARQIEDWKMGFVLDAAKPQARMATANRNLTTLKAALTAAAKLHHYQGHRAWDDVVKFPKSEAHGKRMVILTEAEESQIIAAAAPDCAVLLSALQMTGARYGEIAAALVGDLHGDRLDLSGKTGRRTITLSDRIAAWFADQAGNRPDVEPLLLRADLSGWDTGDQNKPVRQAVEAAKMSSSITSYALRHGFISRALARGVPVMAVAQHVGTSAQMIEESYAKFISGQMKEWFA